MWIEIYRLIEKGKRDKKLKLSHKNIMQDESLSPDIHPIIGAPPLIQSQYLTPTMTKDPKGAFWLFATSVKSTLLVLSVLYRQQYAAYAKHW